MNSLKKNQRFKRSQRTKYRIYDSNKSLRVCVYKSNVHFYAQLIDRCLEGKSKVLAQASTLGYTEATQTKTAQAKWVGEQLSTKLKQVLNGETVPFDRSGYKYTGRVKACAEALRSKGIIF